MPLNKTILKEQLAQLPKKELEQMLLKLANKRFNYEFLLVNFLDPEDGEQTLFDEAKEDILVLHQKEYKGRTLQHQLTKRFIACNKRIVEFTVETKSKKLEADLIEYVLDLQFEGYPAVFGAKYSGYDYKVGLLLKKLINIVTKKMHPDYLIDYQDKINEYVCQLKESSNRIKTIENLTIIGA
jgi:hypothetical protein